MRKDGVWATDIEILALASLLRCDVYVYSSAGARDASVARWLRYEPKEHLPSSMPFRSTASVYINHANRNHYEPAVYLDDNNNYEQLF
jgi:hypothetical protein